MRHPGESPVKNKLVVSSLVLGAFILAEHKGLYEFNVPEKISTSIKAAQKNVSYIISANHSGQQDQRQTESPARITQYYPLPEKEKSDSPAEVLFFESFDGPDMESYVSKDTNGTHPNWFVDHNAGAELDRRDGLGVENGDEQFFRVWTQESFGGEGQSEGLMVNMKIRTDSIQERPGSSITEGTKAQIRFPEDGARDLGAAGLRGDYKNGNSPGTYTFVFHSNNGHMEITKRKTGIADTSKAYDFFDNQQDSRANAAYKQGSWENVQWTIEWLPDGTNRICGWRLDVSPYPIVRTIDRNPDRAMRGPGSVGIRGDDVRFSVDEFSVRKLETPLLGCE